MTQQLLLKPLGVITQPNKLGQVPAGAFSLALHARMRDPGTVEAGPTWAQLGSLAAASSNLSFMIAVGSSILYLTRATATSVWSYRWVNPATGATTFGPLVLEMEDSGTDRSIDTTARWGAVTVRSRTLLLCSFNTMVWDFTAPASTAEATVRAAGLLPPALFNAFPTPSTTAGALKAGQHTHVTAIFRRKYADGYELVSAPSAAMQIISGASAVDISLQISVFTGVPPKAGDIIEVFRTRSQPATLAGGTNTGSAYLLSTTYTITAADIVGPSVSILDTSSDSSLGEALYTNAGLQGAAGASRPPPTAKTIAHFRGHTFYGNYTLPAVFKFRMPVYWGEMGSSASGSSAYVRKNAIGSRTVAGTTAIGSPTVTGVSAADLVGITINQGVSFGTVFPLFTTVIAVGATTITMSVNATAVAAAVTIHDRMEVAGTGYDMTSIFFMLTSGPPGKMYPLLLDLVWPETGVAPAASQTGTIPAADWVVFDRLIFGTTGLPDTVTVRATNGQNYTPRFPRWELSETAQSFAPVTVPNGVAWSEKNQPENCPGLNIDNAGKGEIYAYASTRDALWIFASDGLWRLSGTGGEVGTGYDWRIDPVDSTLSLSGPLAVCVLRDTVFALTNRGFVKIDSSGLITELSQQRLNDVIPGPPWSAPTYTGSTSMYLVADETNDEIVFRDPAHASGRLWIYNVNTDTFVEDIALSTNFHGVYVPSTEDVKIACQASTDQVVYAQSTTTVDQMTLDYQPIYADNPFALRHWQQVDVAMEPTSGSSTVTVSCNGVSAGSRVLSGSSASEYARGGYSVPRNAPAVANNIQISLVTGASAPKRVRVQGVAVHYVDQTDQRNKR